jgi:hypothetical protein
MFLGKWVPVTPDMACAQVVDGGENLRIRRLGEATRDGPLAWGLGKGLTTSQSKKLKCQEI